MARNRQRARDRKQNLHRENVPGSLDHASGDVEEVEAAIVAGARGEPVAPDPELVADEPLDDDDIVIEDERLGSGAGDVAVQPANKPSGFRLFNFLRACWAELQRVDWPDRRQVGQATTVVLGFVVVAGAFLGLADLLAQKIVDLIL
ncbi:MAG TPA: preprotein translocase subunit SecE [Solirubrobacteraceae bacterium]|jgi:preprotein translocase SecE subunit|nr:preprotein translocase subunit SecE [Solirubrobacteraceae bacterium]